MDNPYQSPKTDGSPTGPKQEKVHVALNPSRLSPTRIAMRLVLHMLIAAIVAPAVGGAIYTHETVGRGAPLPPTWGASLVGGCMLLLFIWFLTVPFGLFTYLLAALATRLGVVNRPNWMAGGAVLGLSFGFFIGLWSQSSVELMATSGTVIGLASGTVLREIWLLPGLGASNKA
jgi:hypothetical protein